MYTGGCVALLKPFPDNTSAPLRSHAGGTPAALPSYGLHYACVQPRTPGIYNTASGLYIVFPIGLRPDVCVRRGFTMIGNTSKIDGRRIARTHARVHVKSGRAGNRESLIKVA